MSDKIIQGVMGLMFAFVAFLGSQLFAANNDIVRLNQAMNLLVTPDMQIVPSSKHSSHEVARAKLDAKIDSLARELQFTQKEINYIYEKFL
tara:strand:- start:490 stop:762 length:273 start_codon:yes stop_codon:yes gene_type:complete